MPASNPKNREPLSPSSSEKARRINPHKMFVGNFVPVWLMARPEISSGAKLMYALIARHSGKNGDCFPFQATLADEMAVSERSAGKFLRELRNAKLIEIERRGLTMSNRYHFLQHEWFDCFLKGSVAQNGSAEDPLGSVAGLDRQNRVCPNIVEENQLKELSSVLSGKGGETSFSTESRQPGTKPAQLTDDGGNPVSSRGKRSVVWRYLDEAPPNEEQLILFSRNFWCMLLALQLGVPGVAQPEAKQFLARVNKKEISAVQLLYVLLVIIPGRSKAWDKGLINLAEELKAEWDPDRGSELHFRTLEKLNEKIIYMDIPHLNEKRRNWIFSFLKRMQIRQFNSWQETFDAVQDFREKWELHHEGGGQPFFEGDETLNQPLR